MEEQEARSAARGIAVPFVESIDAGRGHGEQLVVGVGALAVGIEPIGEQREPQVSLSVAEVVDLQAGHLLFDVGGARQQHRNRDQRSQLARHAIVEVEPGQRARTQRAGHRCG